MVSQDLKNLHRRTASVKVLYDKAFIIAQNSNYDEYSLASMVYELLVKNSTATCASKSAGASTHKGSVINSEN